MSLSAKEKQNLSKQDKVSLLAGAAQKVLLEKRDDFIEQILAIAHLETETQTVFGSPVSLDINFTALEEVAEFVEDYSIISSEFEAEPRFDFGSTPLRLIEVDGKTTFPIDQPKHIVGGQHQVSPFRKPVMSRQSYYGSADFLEW